MNEMVHVEVQVHFFLSKFAKFQPKQCVLAGSASTHSMCVGTFHLCEANDDWSKTRKTNRK